jgi:hypothetical protein
MAQFRTHYLTMELAEYSRMQVPSLSLGCEIAPFYVRYMDCRECRSGQMRLQVDAREADGIFVTGPTGRTTVVVAVHTCCVKKK